VRWICRTAAMITWKDSGHAKKESNRPGTVTNYTIRLNLTSFRPPSPLSLLPPCTLLTVPFGRHFYRLHWYPCMDSARKSRGFSHRTNDMRHPALLGRSRQAIPCPEWSVRGGRRGGREGGENVGNWTRRCCSRKIARDSSVKRIRCEGLARSDRALALLSRSRPTMLLPTSNLFHPSQIYLRPLDLLVRKRQRPIQALRDSEKR